MALHVSGFAPGGNRPKFALVTELAVPLGARNILWLPVVNDDTMAFCRTHQVRHVIVDDDIAIPRALTEAAQRISHLPGLTIITLSI